MCCDANNENGHAYEWQPAERHGEHQWRKNKIELFFDGKAPS